MKLSQRLLGARFLLTVVLFLGWLGFLAYEVQTRPFTPNNQPLVLSRPQILTSDLAILANLGSPVGDIKPDGSTQVTVEEVLGGKGLQKGEIITILDLHNCQPLPIRGQPHAPADWSGPGLYLIPLKRSTKGIFTVTPVPSSPGYRLEGPQRIYPATPEALAQYHSIPHPGED
jgi:hypothetical protein